MHNWAAGGGNGDALQAERKKQADRPWAGTQACLRKIRLAWHELKLLVLAEKNPKGKKIQPQIEMIG